MFHHVPFPLQDVHLSGIMDKMKSTLLELLSDSAAPALSAILNKN